MLHEWKSFRYSSELDRFDANVGVALPKILDQFRATRGTSKFYSKLPAHATLCSQGEICVQCFFVLDGWIALSMALKDGSRQIIDFASHGKLVGFQRRPGDVIGYSAECITPSHVFSIPQRAIEELCRRDPETAMELLRLQADEMARLQDHMVNLTCRGARERIAHLLVVLFRQRHRRFPAGERETLVLPLTQVEIGQAVGLTDVHVSRIFTLLHKQNIVRRTGRTFEILDPAELMYAGGFDPASGSEL